MNKCEVFKLKPPHGFRDQSTVNMLTNFFVFLFTGNFAIAGI